MMMMAFGVLFAFVNGAGATLGYCGLAGTKRCIAYGWSGYWIQSMIGDVFGCLICMPALLSWARWIDARLHPDARRAPQDGFAAERRRAPRVPRPAAAHAPVRAESRLPPVMPLLARAVAVRPVQPRGQRAGLGHHARLERAGARGGLPGAAAAGVGRDQVPAAVRAFGGDGLRADHDHAAAHRAGQRQRRPGHAHRVAVPVPAERVVADADRQRRRAAAAPPRRRAGVPRAAGARRADAAGRHRRGHQLRRRRRAVVLESGGRAPVRPQRRAGAGPAGAGDPAAAQARGPRRPTASPRCATPATTCSRAR